MRQPMGMYLLWVIFWGAGVVMKRLLGLLLVGCVVLPVPALAFDWSPDTTRYLSDPSFIPKRGQIESHSIYSYSNSSDKWINASGVNTENSSSSTNAFQEDILYGVTNRLTVGLSGDYNASHGKLTLSKGGETDSSSFGFGNPGISSIFRLVPQGKSPVSVDTQISYIPNIKKNTYQTEGGNIAVSREMVSLTLRGNVGLNHSDSYNGSENQDATWEYSVGMEGQLRFTKSWALNSGISVSKATSRMTVSNGNQTNHSYDMNVDPYVAVQYGIVPNKVVLGLRYAHNFSGDEHMSGYYNGTWTDRSSDTVALHLRMLF